MKKAAVINDLSGFGKCSLTAAIPVLSVMGVQCCPVATAVLTGQTGYSYYHCRDLTDMMEQYTDAWTQNQVHFDSIYTGYVTGIEQIEYIMHFIDTFRKKDTFLLVDPVMGDDGRVYGMYTPELLEGMKKLSRKANLITPNLMEAALLTDSDVSDIFSDFTADVLLGKAQKLGETLRNLAEVPQDVVITGIKCKNDATPFIYNLAVTETGVHTCRSHFFQKSFSGTGDLFASVMCGGKTKGLSTQESMELAKNFLYHSIADTMNEDIPGNAGVNFEKFLSELILN